MTYTINLPYTGTPGFVVTERPDDVEVRFGDSTNKSLPAINLGSYAAQVMSGGVQVATYNIPQHDRFSRWVHEINPDQIIRTHHDIFAQGLMFPYGNPGKKQPAKPGNKFTGPMATAGVYINMGATGERGDIGLLPEWEAYALRTGDFGPCLEAAKGFDSMPIFIIDERTGRFWNMIDHQMATIYWNQNNIPDYIASAPKGQWDMDLGHHPAIYIAYLATGKLRYLESLQALTNWGFQVTNWYTGSIGYPVVNIAQMRSCGWHFRSLLMCWKATQLAERDAGGALPQPLLPSAHWKRLIDLQLKFFTENFMNDPALQTFRYFPDKTSYRPWQFDYVLLSLALAAFFFPGTGWTEVFLWAMDNPVQRLNGRSGWPPAHQEPYFLRLGPPGAMPDHTESFPFDLKPNQFFKTWGEAWVNYCNEIETAGGGENMTIPEIEELKADPFGGGDFINWDSYTPQQLRNVMAAADFLDKNGYAPVTQRLPDFPACRDRIESMVLNWEKQAPGNIIASRVSIVSGTVSLPPPTNTPPPTTPPPGVPPMTVLDPIVNEVHNTEGVIDSAIAFINGLEQKLKDLIAGATGGSVDATQVQSLANELAAKRQTLANAIAANPTPAG